MDAVASYVESNLKALKGLLTAEDVNEIVINPDGLIFVEYSGSTYMEATTDFALSDEDIRAIGYNLAGETKNTLGEAQPIVSGRVHLFGHDVRVQVVIPPAIEAGVSISIRKFVNRVLSVDQIGFVAGKPIDVNKQRYDEQEHLLELASEGRLPELLKEAIENKLNILISGGTSSGKTTVARALLSLTHPDERIITIEDAVELRPENTNKVSLVAERVAGSNRTAARLLESSLRMRPDRLILGEIRGAEAYNFLEAINTGHPGSISTIHADSPALALERMALMVMQTGVPLTRHDVIEYASATIDMIIQVGRRDGKRGVLEIHMPQLSKQ